MVEKIKPFIKFCLTGGLNTLLSYFIYALLYGAFHTPYPLALAVGYIVGMITSFIINTLWTFSKTNLDWSYLWRFLSVNLVLLLLNEGGLRILVQKLHVSAYLGQVINLIPFTLLGFVINKWFVYKDKNPTKENLMQIQNELKENEMV